jgi:ABC-2 type transport system ATP-binding protein
LIQVQHLTKTFPAKIAVSDVSFDVREGEILGFLGPNGAGKTTTMRVVTGFLPPSHGTVVVNGHDVVDEPQAVKRQIGYLPENVPLYQEMRVREYLDFRAALKGVPRADMRKAVDRTLEECIIGDVQDRVVGQLSKGYRQRVGLADALVSDPPILILDEPTIGLDPAQIREIRKLIKDLGRERTVILSSHILPEVEMVCDRVVIISRGRLVGEGTPEELKKQLMGRVGARARIRTAEMDPSALEEIEGVESVDVTDEGGDVHAVTVMAAESDTPIEEEVFRVCVDRGWVLRSLSREAPSLEDIFVEIVAREPEVAEAETDEDDEEAGGEEEES